MGGDLVTSTGHDRSVHLVLSAGGVRCLSYAGAVAALSEHGISFATVSGCSAGSLIGAILCSKAGLAGFREAVQRLDLSSLGEGRPFLGRLRKPYARYRRSRIPDIFRQIVGGDPRFDELEIPFATFGVDVRSYKLHVYSRAATPKMPVAEALRISTAVPFLFPVQEDGENLLLDGALVSQSPVWLATLYDDQRPILVLRPKRDVARPLPSSALEYLTRVIELGGGSFDSYLIQEMPRAHLIEIDCGAIKFDRFDIPVEARNRLVASGRVAVEGRLKELRGLMRSLPSPPIGRDEPPTARVGAEAMKKLFDALPPKRDQVFISYSHNDSDWLHRFQETLKPYTETKPIRIWTDTAIRPGAKWREEIEAALGAAKVAVLLVTISYLASDFVRDVELQKFIEASREHGLRLMPVAVGASMYEESPLRDYQFVNKPDRPLADMDRAEQDREIVRICKEIKKALEGSEVGP